MTKSTIAVMILLAAALGAMAAQPGSPAPAPTSAQPTAPQGPSVASIYTAERLRDPFRADTGGTVVKRKFSAAEFNIHNLTLKGIMADRAADFAVFSDNSYGYTMMLRKGRLFDPKGRPVPGVTGRLDVKRKRASLQTGDGDVQVFRLGAQSMD